MSLANDTPSIDTALLLERCMGNTALVEKLMQAFSASLPIERNLLQDAIDAGELSSVARVAHKLKGTASNMCAQRLSGSAGRLEQAARAALIDQVACNWFDLNQQMETMMDEVAFQGSNAS